MEDNLATRPVFSRRVRDLALKILLDYKTKNDLGWRRVCNEILDFVQPGFTDQAPLLNHGDLSNWGARKSQLGHEKFQIVFDFLTPPVTLQRVDFARASVVVSEEKERDRVASAYHAFFKDDRETDELATAKARVSMPSRLSFVSESPASPTFTVTFIDRGRVYEVHVLRWLGGMLPPQPSRDLGIEHYAGFAVNTIRGLEVCLRHEVSREVVMTNFRAGRGPKELFVSGTEVDNSSPHILHNIGRYRELLLLEHEKVVDNVIDDLSRDWVP